MSNAKIQERENERERDRECETKSDFGANKARMTSFSAVKLLTKYCRCIVQYGSPKDKHTKRLFLGTDGVESR